MPGKKGTGWGPDRLLDLVGGKFGSLTVVALAERDGHRPVWLCRCECGNEVLRKGGRSAFRDKSSCGCLRVKEMVERTRKLEWSSGCFSKFRAYGRSARKRNISFELSLGEFQALTSRSCTYCDAPPSSVHYAGSGKAGEPFIYNGIDRVDSDGGYVEGECGHVLQNVQRSKIQHVVGQLSIVDRSCPQILHQKRGL